MVKMLELLALDGVPLSKVVSGLPAVHIVHETVVTPWEQKGTVMRTLVELSKDREVDLVDGVKVHHDDGWALALPDPGGAGHPHLGRERLRRRRPPPGAGVRPAHPPARCR